MGVKFRLCNMSVPGVYGRWLHALGSILVLQLFLVTSVHAESNTIPITPGIYEGIMLAIDKDGKLQGFYNQGRGVDVSFSCSFYLSGQLKNDKASIVTWFDTAYQGELHVVDDKEIKLVVPKGREHPGCVQLLLPEIEETGLQFSRTAKATWQSLKVVKNKRAYLYSAPSATRKTKSYFIQADVLGVVTTQGEWLEVEFPRDGATLIKSWVNKSDLEDFPKVPSLRN